MANNSASYNVNMRFTADTGQAKQQLSDLQHSLDTLMNQVATKNVKFFDVNATKKEIDEASAAVQELKIALDQATNVNTGRLDLSKFSKSLSQSGYTLQDFATHLENLGPTGDKAFVQLAQSVINAEVPLKRTNALLDNFKKTLANTVKWQISSNIMHGVQGSLQKAYYYAEDLNRSLNEIRIVTGQSSDQMAQFAEKANKAAQALSTTTTNYTNASLIYYQQGLSNKEVADRTEVTIKMANAAGESASKVSDQLTAVWNNFYDGSKSLEYYADVMTKLGAYTASSTDEISAGIQKFASVANTIGLSYEYATSALATLTARTRESADTVGNSLKTLFARIQGLTLGETLEDGTDLNKYSKALEKVGINIKDQQGELKDMNTILDEMMNKWDSLSRAEQVALAQTVGGVRQYTQLVNLMENKDYFKELVGVAKNSEGTLQKQADIYAESWEASKKRVQASLEEIYKQLVNDKFFIGLNDTLSDTLNITSKLIDSLGGLPGVLSIISTSMLKAFGPEIVSNMQRIASNLFIDSGAAENQAAVMKQQMIKVLKTFTTYEEQPDLTKQGSIELETTTMVKAAEASYDLQLANSQLNETDKLRLQTLLKISQAYGQIAIESKKSIEAQQAQSNNNLRNARNIIFEDNNKKFGGDKGVIYFDHSLKKGQKIIDNFYNDKTIQDLKSLKINPNASFADFISQFNQLDLSNQKYSKLNQLIQQGKSSNIGNGAKGTIRKDILAEINNLKDVNLEIDNYVNQKIKAEKLTKAQSNALRQCLTDYENEKEALLQNEGAVKKYESAIEAFNAELKASQGSIYSFSQGLVSSFQGISQLSIGINSLKGMFNTLNNSELDFGEKLTQSITSASFAIPSLINGVNQLSRGLKEIGTNWKGLGTNILSIMTGLGGSLQGSDLQSALEAKIKVSSGFRAKIMQTGLDAYTAKLKELGVAADSAGTAEQQLAANGAATNAMFAKSLLVLGKYVLIIAAVVAAIAVLVKLYNTAQSFTLEEQIKRSEQAVENFKSQLEETKNKAEQLKSVFDSYNSVKSALDKCTVGTKEWRTQLTKANEEALNILNTYPELKNMEGAWGKKDTGEIWIDESAVDKLQSIYDKQILQQQYALANEQSNLEDLNIKKAKQDLTDNLQGVLNIQSGTQTGGLTKNGQYTSVISGIADLILNNQENLQNKSEEEQISIIEQALKDNGFETLNDSTTLNDYAQKIADKFNTDDIQAAISNVSKVIQANTDATLQITKEASVQQALGLDTMSTEDAKITTALVDANIEAIKNSFYNENGTISWDDGTDKNREIGTYAENAGESGKEDQALRNLWDAYLAAAKIDKNDSEYKLNQKNSVIGEGQNRSFQLENGKTILFSEVATAIATMQAMGEELQTTYAMAQKFQTGMTNQGTVGQGVLEFFGNDGDLSNFTQDQLKQLKKDIEKGFEDEDLQNLIGQSLFGENFNLLNPKQQETVKSYMSNMMKELGVTSGKELGEAIVEEASRQVANIEDINNNKAFKYILGLEDEDDISEAIDEFERYSVSLKSRISQIAEDIFKVAGKNGVAAFTEAINTVGKDLTFDQLNKIADFDWSSGTWKEFIDTLEDLGIVVSDDEGAWKGFYDMMQETADKLPIEDFTTFRDLLIEIFNLMGQEVGSSITQEKYDEITKGFKAAGLNPEDYYVQTGPDTYIKVKDFDTATKNALTQAGIDRAEEQHNVAEAHQEAWGSGIKQGGYIFNGQEYTQLEAMQKGLTDDSGGSLLQQVLDIFGSPEEIAKLVGTDEIGNYDLDFYKRQDSATQAAIMQGIIDAYMANIDGSYNADLLRTNTYTDANSVKEMNQMTGFNLEDEVSQEGLRAWASQHQDIEGVSTALDDLNYNLDHMEETGKSASEIYNKFFKDLRGTEIKQGIENIKEYKKNVADLEEQGKDTTEENKKIKNEIKDLFNLTEEEYRKADDEGLIQKFLYGNETEQQAAGEALDNIKGDLNGIFSYIEQMREKYSTSSLFNFNEDEINTQTQQFASKMDEILNKYGNFNINGNLNLDATQALTNLLPLSTNINDMCGWLNAMGKTGIHFDTSQLQQLFTAFEAICKAMQDPTNPANARTIGEARRFIGNIVSVAAQNSTVPNVNGNDYTTTVSGNTGGGGGGSSESKSASDIGKEIQDKRIAVNEKKRERLETLRDGANPEDAQKYIKEEIDLLEEEQQLLEQQIKSWKTLLKTKVQEFNAKHPELEITLDDKGEIANASELWGKVWAQYEKNMQDGMSGEDLNEWFTKISNDINGPMGIQENIDENVAAIAQKEKEQAELELESITKAIDWKVKQIDFQIKRLNYYQEKLLKQAHGNKQTIEAMLEGFAYQEQEMLQLFNKGATLRSGIDQLNSAKAQYPDYAQMFDEQILDYQSDLIDVNEAILDLRNDIEDLVQNVMDLALDEIDKQIERLDTYTSMLDHLNNIIDLSGRSMLDMGLKTQIGATKVQTMIGKMTTLKGQMDGLVKAQKEAEAALADRRADGDESSVKFWENQVEVIKQEVEKASDEFLGSWEETLEAAQDLFEMRVEMAVNTLSNALSPFETLEQFQDKYEKAKTINDQYLDDAERLYELSKLNRQLNLQMKDTDDLLAQEKLKEIQKEINDLQADGVQMSQYDLDYLQKKYDLQLAEIALMEQQNSKTSMRLVRDAAGNWTYAYDADEEKIEDATQKYEDAVHELGSLSKDYINDVSEQLIQNQIDFKEALQDLDKNSADYSNQLLSLQEYYVERQRYLLDELNKGVVNSGLTFHDTLYGQMTDLYDYNDAYMQFVNNSNITISELQTNYKDWQKVVETAMNVAGTSWDNFGTDMGGTLDSLEEHIQKLCDEIEELVNVLMGYISQSIGMVLDWEQKYSKRTDWELAKNEAYIDGNFGGGGGGYYNQKVDMQTDFTKLLERWDAGERNLSNYNGSKTYNNVEDIYADLAAKLDAAQQGEKIKYEGSGKDFSDKDQASTLDKFIKGYNSQGGRYNSYSYPNTYSNKIVDKASNYLGTKYTYGGKDASTGLDCSGLVYKALNDAGVSVPVLTAEGYKQMAKFVSQANAKPGDLVFFGANGVSDHVGIYMGNGQMINATGTKTQITNIDTKKAGLIGYGRIGNSNTSSVDEFIKRYNGAAAGAYTGNWGPGQGLGIDNGKIIKVHPKELILNKSDTKNILRAVDIVRDMNNWVDDQIKRMNQQSQSVISNLMTDVIPSTYNNQPIQQEVKIEANFPGVTDHYEIEEALSNLSNDAAQYISANKNR